MDILCYSSSFIHRQEDPLTRMDNSIVSYCVSLCTIVDTRRPLSQCRVCLWHGSRLRCGQMRLKLVTHCSLFCSNPSVVDLPTPAFAIGYWTDLMTRKPVLHVTIMRHMPANSAHGRGLPHSFSFSLACGYTPS